ncbi:creatininase [Acetobacter sicerae]|uniref:Creatininase n=1 Tax=Acetobacter sicerae TaxID=85325 RepID=A0ABS8VYJ0_9PROT|nr:creatininase [Acetobacter sicerae]MCE0744961.1 creatininase [Acetobacter sicerae]
MSRTVKLAELTWPDFAARVAENPVVFLPIGATEQHGPHLPLNVDQVLPTAVAERVAEKVGGLVAPTLPYGYKSQPRSGGGEHFPGTIGLDANTLTLVIRDIVCRLAHHGVKRIVLVNGHFENAWPAVEGLDLAMRDVRRDGIEGLTAMRLEYWDFVERATLDRLFPEGFPGTELEHASLLETSLMLLVRDDLVDMSKVPNDGPATFPPYDRWPLRADFVPPSGVLARAQGSTAEKGQWLMDDHTRLLAEAISKEFGL